MCLWLLLSCSGMLSWQPVPLSLQCTVTFCSICGYAASCCEHYSPNSLSRPALYHLNHLFPFHILLSVLDPTELWPHLLGPFPVLSVSFNCLLIASTFSDSSERGSSPGVCLILSWYISVSSFCYSSLILLPRSWFSLANLILSSWSLVSCSLISGPSPVPS